MTVLVLTASASAAVVRDVAIDPGTPVNGMLVVQGVARDADADLFGAICDPVVLRPGRRTRSCGQLPPVRRVFVGHGIFAPEKKIDSAWKSMTWDMWIDRRHVSLRRFGHSDRWLGGFAPAGGRDVVLREWAIILVGAEGRHSIRYRTRSPSGVGDTTWRFVVTPS
jgi:hypothetical protein